MNGIRRDSYRNPDGVREDSGYGRSSSSSKETSSSRPRGYGGQSSETLAAIGRSEARMAEWIAWAEKTFPELPERANVFAAAGMMVKRSGRKPTRQNVLERVWEQHGDLCREFGFPEVGA
jgi:hypothetical protein